MAERARAGSDTKSFWIDSASLPSFEAVRRDDRADVVIVGGGLTGLTATYLLSAAGKSVVLLERARCAQVDTGHTTAHLTMVTDERLSDLVQRFGRDHAQAVWDAGLAAIAQIDQIVREQAIACGFEWVDGYLHAAPDSPAEERRRLEGEADLARSLGFDTEFMAAVPLMRAPGIRVEGQARFHPREYLAGLARSVTERGGRIHEHSDASEFSSDPFGVKVNGHTIACDSIVLATHNPLVGTAGIVSATLLQTKLALYTSYVVAGRVRRGTVPDALFWDTADPYHYLRIHAAGDHDMVIFGGEDHKTGQTTDTAQCFQRLEARLKALIAEVAVTHRWSGQVIETPDGLPYIGPMGDRQYLATGFAGNGMTFGTLGAMMIADAITGRANPWADLFDPGRKALGRSTWEYLKENKDYPYYLIRDRFAGGEARSLRAVKRGHGTIVDRNGARVAAYRHEDGTVTMRSATCTHMGCVVGWNDAEHTWDCPCHGSRFTTNGDVISGPAESPLAAVD
jgi:glycine/D-amino acid oxidase-like deaminating enzyme/nitrite reductase/ring-hydroxylating ferredoxin subunit